MNTNTNKPNKTLSALPEKYSFDREGLRHDGNLIASYRPVVLAVKNCVHEGKTEPYVLLGAVLPDGTQVHEVNTPLRHLNALDMQSDVDSRCFEYPGRVSRHLVQCLIRSLVARHQAVEVYQASTLGFHHYNGKVAYCAGSRLIGDLGVEVEITTNGYGFYPPTDLSNEQLGAHIKSIIQLEPSVTAPLFSYNILGFLRDLFREAGVPIHFCMYLAGEQQSLKTTLATHLCSLFDRHEDVEKHLHNLTASEAKLHEILNLEKDMVAIIDDLNLDDSKSREREQEAKIGSLIRASANGVGRDTMKGQKAINAQPLFCGEYLLKNTSTNNRLLIVHLEQGQIDKEKLRDIQKNVNFLTGFAERFISWVLDNYQSLCGFISEQYAHFLDQRAEGVFYQERLNRSAAVLAIAYGVLLRFCKANGWDLGLSAQGFSTIMENLLQRQLEDMNQQGRDETDYVVEIFQFLRMEEDHGLVKKGRPKNNLWKRLIYHDEDLERFFIRSDKMGQISVEISENLKKAVSIHVLLDALDAEGIVIKDNNKNGARSKKVGGYRCYVLDYVRLQQYMQELLKEYEDEQDSSSSDSGWTIPRR